MHVAIALPRVGHVIGREFAGVPGYREALRRRLAAARAGLVLAAQSVVEIGLGLGSCRAVANDLGVLDALRSPPRAVSVDDHPERRPRLDAR